MGANCINIDLMNTPRAHALKAETSRRQGRALREASSTRRAGARCNGEEVRGAQRTPDPPTHICARFAVFTNSPILSLIHRKHWRSTVSRKPSSTNSSRPWTRSPNRTASSHLLLRALSASIVASSSAHHVYVTPYQFISLPLLPDQNLLRSIFLYIAYVALSPNTPKHTDSHPFPLVSFSVVVWSNRSKRNISIPISWTLFISCQR